MERRFPNRQLAKIDAPTSAQACPCATAERSLCAPYVSVNVPSHQSGVFPAATANNDTVPAVYTDTVGHNA